jgi:DNA-binding beta-propeller fold protein YncE
MGLSYSLMTLQHVFMFLMEAWFRWLMRSKGTIVGKITGLNGVHGIAIDPDLYDKGFISTGKDSSVTIFNTKSLQVITKVAVTGKSPDAIMFDSFSKKVFVFNGKFK